MVLEPEPELRPGQQGLGQKLAVPQVRVIEDLREVVEVEARAEATAMRGGTGDEDPQPRQPAVAQQELQHKLILISFLLNVRKVNFQIRL